MTTDPNTPAAPAGHLDPDLLDRAMSGEASGADRAALVRHLVAACPGCATRLAVEVEDHPALRPGGIDYDAAFTRVLANLPEAASRRAEERLRAGLQWAALDGLAAVDRRRRVLADLAFHHPGFVEVTLERAEQMGPFSPVEGIALAQLAAEVAGRLAAVGALSPAVAADLEADALALAGENRRRADDLDGAAAAFQQARQRREQGTGEPLGEAGLLVREARLLRVLGEPADALRALDRARRSYGELDDQPGIARTLLGEAQVRGFWEPAEAVRLAQVAVTLLEPAADPRRELAALLQLGWHLADAGRAEEARAMLAEGRTRPGRGGRPERLLRLWLEARVALALGRPGEAAPALAEVAASWRSLGRPWATTFAALDHARALQAAGQAAAAGRAVDPLLAAFEPPRLHDQGRALFYLLAERLRDGRAQTEACPCMVEYLLQAWCRPMDQKHCAGEDRARKTSRKRRAAGKR
jgi:tetratricopeptide (TPR) repeat protein